VSRAVELDLPSTAGGMRSGHGVPDLKALAQSRSDFVVRRVSSCTGGTGRSLRTTMPPGSASTGRPFCAPYSMPAKPGVHRLRSPPRSRRPHLVLEA
jgi:hypothetical protein